METREANIAACIERLKRDTGSDFVVLGSLDAGKRKLRWSNASGSMSKRTLLVEQKPTAGLSGTAIRSARLASTGTALSDAERFKLGEPILLAEQLRIAASIPIVKQWDVCGVLLMGRRSEEAYLSVELEEAGRIAKEMAAILLQERII